MLAGYITAKTVDLALVRQKNNQVQLYGRATYNNADFSSLESILSNYLNKHKAGYKSACFGVAGPVIDDRVTASSIPWQVRGSDIEKEFNFDKVCIVNDLVATATGLFELGDEQFFSINQGTKKEDGNIGLLASGAGLGEALIYYDGKLHVNYASEGGHCDFAPGSQIEAALWQYLYTELGHVEVEDVVSLRGVERIYNFLVETQNSPDSNLLAHIEDRPARILELALAGENETAVKTVDIFIDCYASEAANLALKGMALGGIYLGGLIAPRIMTLLDTGRFMDRFVKNGKMAKILSRIPVALIIEEKTALLGAARLSLGE